jgi:hypothetical protein
VTRSAGGQDAQHLMPASHPSFPLAANVSTRYLLRTHDGVFIQVQTRGWRTGPKEVLQRLSDAAREGFTGEAPKPTEYKFRLEIEMETDARNEKYAWLNTAMWIGAGVRSGRQGARQRGPPLCHSRDIQADSVAFRRPTSSVRCLPRAVNHSVFFSLARRSGLYGRRLCHHRMARVLPSAGLSRACFSAARVAERRGEVKSASPGLLAFPLSSTIFAGA